MKKVRQRPVPEKDQKNFNIITHQYLVKLCEFEDKYATPKLNDSLCLQNKGFAKLENLDQYYNLKCLYFNNNIIQKIENLESLNQMRCLYLQNNRIQKIEGISHMKNLCTLNLAHNCIQKIENLDGLDQLTNINLSFNELKLQESIEGLIEVQNLSTVDLSNNQMDGDDTIVDFFSNFADLRVIYLKNNQLVRKISNYRKQMVAGLKHLRYLDDRPVSINERKLCEKWKEGGIEGEAQERLKIIQDKEESHQRYLQEIKDNRKKYENFYNEHRIKKLEDLRLDLHKQNDELQQQRLQIEMEVQSYEEEIQSSEKCQKMKEDNIFMLKSNAFKINQITQGIKSNKQEIELIEQQIDQIKSGDDQQAKHYQQNVEQEVLDADQILQQETSKENIYWSKNMIQVFEQLLLKENFNFNKAIDNFNEQFNLNCTEKEARNIWTQITVQQQQNLEDLDQLNYKYENRTQFKKSLGCRKMRKSCNGFLKRTSFLNYYNKKHKQVQIN